MLYTNFDNAHLYIDGIIELHVYCYRRAHYPRHVHDILHRVKFSLIYKTVVTRMRLELARLYLY